MLVEIVCKATDVKDVSPQWNVNLIVMSTMRAYAPNSIVIHVNPRLRQLRVENVLTVSQEALTNQRRVQK